MFYNMFYASSVCWNVSSTTSIPHIQANKNKLSPICLCVCEKPYCEMIKLKKKIEGSKTKI
jgi:hypothetical protein